MALVETGTRALPGAVFGPAAGGETGQALSLLHLLDKTMLLLTDRGFDSGDFLAAVNAAGARFLGRLNGNRRPPVLRHLPDGSFLSVIGGVKVRIITADVTVTCHDGTSYGGTYRLATILLDHRAFSRWNKHPEGKPRASKRITRITSNIDPRHYQPRHAGRHP